MEIDLFLLFIKVLHTNLNIINSTFLNLVLSTPKCSLANIIEVKKNYQIIQSSNSNFFICLLMEMRGVEPLSVSPSVAVSTRLVISFQISTYSTPSDRFQVRPVSISPLLVKTSPKVVACINMMSALSRQED